VPSNIPGRASASLSDQLKVLTHPRLLIIYAVTALGYGGVFTAFTFLAPMMQDLAGFSPNAVSWILLGYGISVAIGNIWGGKLADKHGAVPALKFIFAALVVLLMIFQFTASCNTPRWSRYWSWGSSLLATCRASGLCCAESRALYAKCGGCGIGSEHCRIQYWHRAGFHHWRANR
jgi:predicted MFS family arabinose efflux permease